MLGRETSVATGWSDRWSVYQLERMHKFSGFELDMHCNSVYG